MFKDYLEKIAEEKITKPIDLQQSFKRINSAPTTRSVNNSFDLKYKPEYKQIAEAFADTDQTTTEVIRQVYKDVTMAQVEKDPAFYKEKVKRLIDEKRGLGDSFRFINKANLLMPTSDNAKLMKGYVEHLKARIARRNAVNKANRNWGQKFMHWLSPTQMSKLDKQMPSWKYAKGQSSKMPLEIKLARAQAGLDKYNQYVEKAPMYAGLGVGALGIGGLLLSQLGSRAQPQQRYSQQAYNKPQQQPFSKRIYRYG